jgi:hypothetical protein
MALEDNGPNVTRSSKVYKGVHRQLAIYKLLYEEKKRTSSLLHLLLNRFLKLVQSSTSSPVPTSWASEICPTNSPTNSPAGPHNFSGNS